VSQEDSLRRAREEIARLEAERLHLSTDVMEGRPGALEEDERLRQRITELGHWLLEAQKEGRVSETPNYEDVLQALRVRLAGSPRLRDQPAEDIAHDLMTNGYLSTEPDPALVRRALAHIREDGGPA
jgi:dihydroneopterin aldolase